MSVLRTDRAPTGALTAPPRADVLALRRSPTVVLGVAAVMAAPTWCWPDSELASVVYLVTLTAIVSTVGWTALRRTGLARIGWSCIALATACWLAGDLAQRLAVVFGHETEAVGLPDVFWLASYPLMVAGVSAMVHGRALASDVRREVALDVLVVTVAGALGVWKLMIAPEVGDGTLTLDLAVAVLYPLGDVALLATALTLLFAPGHPSAAGRLLVGCLGATLVLDAAFTALPQLAPSFPVDRLDAVLLVVNAMLAAAALHPSGERLADPSAAARTVSRMHRWRVVLLGSGLVTVSVAAVVPTANAARLDTAIVLLAASATSIIVVGRFYGVVRKREEAELLLDHQAHHDHLTGIANRALMMRHLDDALRVAPTGADDRIVLMYLDLDGFKAVNDRFGHAMGDEVLAAVAERLEREMRTDDLVARFGGDEFVVLCTGLAASDVVAMGDRLRRAVSAPIELSIGDRVQIGVSIGIADVAIPDRAGAGPMWDGERLLCAADAAMYDVKRVGGGVRVA